jgi:hypothetical protein
MPDVFISYAREDRDRARQLAEALQDRGWSVWWDRKIVAGEKFDRTIEQQLEAASSVVVLWSAHSIGSEWVRNEAGLASEREVLVPALIENVKQPLEFRRRQAADLTRWTGDPADPEFQALCDGITAKTRGAVPIEPRGEPAQPPTPPLQVRRDARDWRWVAAAVGIVIAGGAGYGIWRVATGGAPEVDEMRVVDAPSAATSADNPAYLTPGTIQKIGLDSNQEYYLQLPEPVADLKVVADMRLTDHRSSNLQSRISLLDDRGAVLQDRVIVFNEIDVGARQTATWSTRQPVRVGLRLLNGDAPADFWLSVRPASAVEFVPLFGSVVPESLSLGEEKTGVLDLNEDAYYVVALHQGEYEITVDFANAEGRNTNIQGLVAILDADGGNYRVIARFNEIDVTSRKVETFLVRDEGPAVFNVQNGHDTVRYRLRLAAAGANR